MKVIWFLFGDPQTTASSRIHGLAVHRELLKLGYQSHIAYLPYFIEPHIPFNPQGSKLELLLSIGDIAILQKIKDQDNLEFLRFLKTKGIRLILLDCDLPIGVKVGQLANKIICTSKTLCTYYESAGLEASYIEDSPEYYSKRNKVRTSAILQCYWFGDGTDQKWKEVLWLKQVMLEVEGWKLVTISNHPEADLKWKPEIWKTLQHADAIALPAFVQHEESKVKSANRLLQAMALSVPVVCSPLPSYQDIIMNPEEGIICTTEQEWVNAFKALKNVTTRKNMITAGYIKSTQYKLDQQIGVWLRELNLDMQYLITDQTQYLSDSHEIRSCFYHQLLDKNLRYVGRMPINLTNLKKFFFCTANKLWQKLRLP